MRHDDLKDQCVIFSYVLQVYNHLNLRIIVFLLPFVSF